MILTNKQAIILYQIAYETLSLHAVYGGLILDVREKFVNEILQQQSDELIELGRLKDKNNKEKK